MRRLQFLIAFASLALSCVDKVDLSLPSGELPLILEGSVTDNSAPDTIRLSRAYPADGKYHPRIGVPGAKMWITNNSGVVDTLIDNQNGIYVTNALQGVIGRTYTLGGRITGKDNSQTTFASSAELMLPAGVIETIYYELTSKPIEGTSGTEDGLNVFIDATVDPSSTHQLRWKFNGTYVFMSDPASVMIPVPCLNPVCPEVPLACAENCLCCTCYATEREDLPLVTSPTFLGGTSVKRVFVKYITIDNLTFYEKYHVEVTQMELSKPVFEFYEGIRKQMQNANSLFQPPFFGLAGNVKVTAGQIPLIGVFSAAAEVKKARYILRNEIPYTFQFKTLLPGDCRAVVKNSTLTPPPFWN